MARSLCAGWVVLVQLEYDNGVVGGRSKDKLLYACTCSNLHAARRVCREQRGWNNGVVESKEVGALQKLYCFKDGWRAPSYRHPHGQPSPAYPSDVAALAAPL